MTEDFLFTRALLIEDDSSHAFLISRALGKFCREIVHARSLGEGKDLAKNRILDLIVTDLNLPDSSKALSVKSIREIASDVPVIALTSSNLLQDAVEAMKHGASDFIVKEFGPDFGDILGLALSRVAASQVLKAERTRLQAEMLALRAAIENGSDGMAVAKQSGEITYNNRAFADFVLQCQGSPESVSTLFGSAVKGAERVTLNLLDKCRELTLGAVWSAELLVQRDETFTFEINLSIVQGVSGRAAVLWIKDISDLKRKEKFQRDMLATTTHDLKNPLSAISVSAELLQGMPIDNIKAKELILRVASSAQSAINLIEEFLSARRIKEGSFILRPQLNSPVAAVQEELANFDAVFQTRKLELVTEFKAAPEQWKLDKLGLQRVVTNLLSNAVKFSSKGGKITIGVAVEADELHVKISDTGSGMEPSEVQHIFERYSRLERHAGVTGTGLGLFVVKSVVGAHGGRIEVTSQLGQGTTFEVILPKEPPVNERGELISLDFTA